MHHDIDLDDLIAGLTLLLLALAALLYRWLFVAGRRLATADLRNEQTTPTTGRTARQH